MTSIGVRPSIAAWHLYTVKKWDLHLVKLVISLQSKNKIRQSRWSPAGFLWQRRLRNCFQTRPMQAFPKQQTPLEVRGKFMRSNLYGSSPASIYMLSVTDFNPNGTISEVRVHAGDLFGHTGRWPIAKRSRFSTKLSRSFDHHGNRSFDHHGETKKELLKQIVSRNEKKPGRPQRSVRKIDEYVIDYVCEDACVKFANVKSVTWEIFARGRWDALTRTPSVYRVIVPVRWGEGRGRLIIVCGAPWPTTWRGNNHI